MCADGFVVLVSINPKPRQLADADANLECPEGFDCSQQSNLCGVHTSPAFEVHALAVAVYASSACAVLAVPAFDVHALACAVLAVPAFEVHALACGLRMCGACIVNMCGACITIRC